VDLAQIETLISARPGGVEGEPIRNLRRFTNFLMPNPGVFSLDTWTGVLLWVRNALINWLIFAPVFAAIVALPILYFAVVCAVVAPPDSSVLDTAVAVAAAGCLLFGCYQGLVTLPSHSHPDEPVSKTERPDYGPTGRDLARRVVLPMVAWCLLAPLALGAVVPDSGVPDAARAVFSTEGPCIAPPALAPAPVACPPPVLEPDSPLQTRFILLPLLSLLACLAAYGLAYVQIRLKYPDPPLRNDHLRPFWRSGWAFLLSTSLSAALIWYGTWLCRHLDVFWLALAGPAWIALSDVLRTTIYVAFRKEGLRADLDREWLARLNAAKLFIVLAGTLVGSVVVLGGLAVASLSSEAFSALTAGGLSAGSAAALIGKSARTAFAAQQTEPTKARLIPTDILIGIGIVLFGLAILVVFGRAVAVGAGGIVSALTPSASAPVWGLALAVLAILLGALALAWWLGRRINLNRFSLHAVYRNRLVRAFLGSARPEAMARPDRFTDFDPFDNLRVTDAFDRREPMRLMPVINVALNRTSGKDTARAERMAEPFTITPLRCGAATLCGPGADRANKAAWQGAYVRSDAYAGNERQTGSGDEAKGISLGTAMTISGAAASPNMGYYSSPIVAFVMTLFNVRLGAWLPNPGMNAQGSDLVDTLKASGPRNALPALLNELLGRSDTDNDYLYLSDGGHFDNLGLYEMLRRKCRLIVAIDASQDKAYSSEEFGRVKQRVLIDLGITIDFTFGASTNGKPLPPPGSLGRITYVDGSLGRLLIVKPWISNDLPLELRAFLARKSSFPHESTANQFFTESDFESYRRLGEFVVDRIIGTGSSSAPANTPPTPLLDAVFAGLP
jgi:hypothetical protein